MNKLELKDIIKECIKEVTVNMTDKDREEIRSHCNLSSSQQKSLDNAKTINKYEINFDDLDNIHSKDDFDKYNKLK